MTYTQISPMLRRRSRADRNCRMFLVVSLTHIAPQVAGKGGRKDGEDLSCCTFSLWRLYLKLEASRHEWNKNDEDAEDAKYVAVNDDDDDDDGYHQRGGAKQKQSSPLVWFLTSLCAFMKFVTFRQRVVHMNLLLLLYHRHLQPAQRMLPWQQQSCLEVAAASSLIIRVSTGKESEQASKTRRWWYGRWQKGKEMCFCSAIVLWFHLVAGVSCQSLTLQREFATRRRKMQGISTHNKQPSPQQPAIQALLTCSISVLLCSICLLTSTADSMPTTNKKLLQQTRRNRRNLLRMWSFVPVSTLISSLFADLATSTTYPVRWEMMKMKEVVEVRQILFWALRKLRRWRRAGDMLFVVCTDSFTHGLC